MNTAEELKKWHEYITPQGLSKDELLALYDRLYVEEMKEVRTAKSDSNFIKESADVAIVCAGWLYHCGGWNSVELAINGDFEGAKNSVEEWSIEWCWLGELITNCEAISDRGISYKDAISAVTKNNMTKFVLDSEMSENLDHFVLYLGIDCYTLEIEPNLFAIYPSDDQTDNRGKEYTANKLLKPKGYKSIDESTRWWKL